ncbi:hypothetical protein H072_3152 [Dactylellina haptotyla CBS 200.50]|uniref:Major facilitator superfamily (MFS) profile domain-containing protein n=1 Tax=Dactylellina haptotyla (strain CBS 200.50) TaxID=1284197 RepID=S8AIG9_DACHA|nr:hypothetical protein H072_3152 [Dactylellina haptotyla CBS 200.50]
MSETAAVQRSRWQVMMPVIVCGSGLFSDGYLNGIIGTVNTILGRLYGDEYKQSPAQSNVSSIAFAGTIIGMLVFGYISDNCSRKLGMVASTAILIVFAALCAGAYGAGGTVGGLLAALTAYRFLLGIGIGGEYPAGSVACSEATGELKSGSRNRWFIIFTNVMIDFGFVIAAFAPLCVLWIFGMNRLEVVWRVSLALGVIPPLSIIYLRTKLKEPEQYKRETMRDTKTPWLLVFKFYWVKLAILSIIWFIYDFSAYSFGIYGSSILEIVVGEQQSLYKPFGWNVVLNLFYIPGAIAGSFISDWIGAKETLTLGLALQGFVGLIMAGCYGKLATPEHVAGFVVVYGIFLTLGELGAGDNIGLLASKSSATAIRGQFYGIAAAVGKIGAFVGTYVFPIIVKNAGGSSTVKGNQAPFWVSSALCLFSAALAWFCLPHVGQDTITEEDLAFRNYLTANGYDTSTMGVKELRGERLDDANSADGVVGSSIKGEEKFENVQM